MADLSKLSDKELDAMIAQQQSSPDLAGVSDEDLDRMIAEAGGPSLPEPKRHNQVDSAVMAGLQGAAGGFLDELSGVGEAAGRLVGVKGLGSKLGDQEFQRPEFLAFLEGKLPELKQAYIEGRDKKRELLADQAKEYPGTTGTAGVVGSLVSPVNKIAKGQRLVSGAAGIGMVNALGNSEAKDAKGMLVDSAIGATVGGALGVAADKGAKLADKGVKKVSEKSRAAAEWLAARAIGAERGSTRALGHNRVVGAGAQALDEGVLSAFANTDDMIARNNAVKAKGGELMEKAYAGIDDAGASTFNPLNVAAKVDDELSPTFRTAINKGETNQLENTLESILARGDKNIPLKDAQKLKQEIGAVAFPKGKKPLDPSPKQQMAMDAYEIVNKSIDEAVEAGSKHIENAGLSDVLAKGKKLYGGSKVTGKLLENKQNRELGNKFGFGLTDTIWATGFGAYGLSQDDPATAIGLMAGKKYLEKYGAQQTALMLNKLSKNLAKSPALVELAKKSPPLAVSIAQKLERRGAAAAASNEELQPELKGKDKWVSEGFGKVMKHSPDVAGDLDQAGRILNSERGRDLLMQASDLKPGSKAMADVAAKLKQLRKGG